MRAESLRLSTYVCLVVALLGACRDEPKRTPPKWTNEAKARLEAFARDRCAEHGQVGKERATCKEPRGEYEVDADGERIRSLKLQMATTDADATPTLLDEALDGLVSEEIIAGIRARLRSPKPTDHFKVQDVEVDVGAWNDEADSALRFLHTTVEMHWR